MDEIDSTVDELVKQLISSGPDAITNCKELLRRVSEMSLEEAKKYTAEIIAKLRISEEGQEGMNAFLDKRRPRWVDDSNG